MKSPEEDSLVNEVLLPLPWALMARGCWHLMEPKLQESFLQHEMRTERKQIAEMLGFWIGIFLTCKNVNHFVFVVCFSIYA